MTMITIPKKVYRDLISATESFERAQNELEDFILSHNKNFITKVSRMRKTHQQKKFGNWSEFKMRYGL